MKDLFAGKLSYKFSPIPENVKRKICKNVWRIHHLATHVCKSDNNIIKRLFTNFSYTTIKIAKKY